MIIEHCACEVRPLLRTFSIAIQTTLAQSLYCLLALTSVKTEVSVSDRMAIVTEKNNL